MPPYFGGGPSSSEFRDFVEQNARQHAELRELTENVKTDLAQHSHEVMLEMAELGKKLDQLLEEKKSA